ncbi:hypothetical protein BJ684DRAFT_21406, partial [Piptocephalis cylindrospora]
EDETAAFITRLVREVSERAGRIGLVGAQVQLRLYRRQKDAPEPYKFMGHGACDILHHTLNLPFLTHAAEVMEPIVQAKVRELCIPPEDVRGASIQLQKCRSMDQDDGNRKDWKTGSSLIPGTKAISNYFKAKDDQLLKTSSKLEGKRPTSRSSSLTSASPKRARLKSNASPASKEKAGEDWVDVEAWRKTESMLEEEAEQKQILDPWSLAVLPQSILMDVVFDDFSRMARAKEDRVGRRAVAEAERREGREANGACSGPIHLPEEDEPHLGGQATLEGVRILLQEWVEEQGTSGPREEEIIECTEYFSRLVHTNNLHRARLLWRHLRSLSEGPLFGPNDQGERRPWRKMVMQVDECITNAVRSRYGNPQCWVEL